ncbi:MAG: AAA family ATPase [Gloeomargarita sp. SKYG98]|nr:AAA family ATPase [Gloeomargarita sp. SKYG98]
MLNCLTANSEELLDILALGYRTDIPVYIVGPPGIGKSETVARFAQLIHARMPNALILSTIQPEDLRGVGVPNSKTKRLDYYQLQFFPPSDSAERWVLFYDELSNADKRLQAPLQQLILHKQVGDYTLPKDCYQVAAGNDIHDECYAYDLSRALMDRFLVVKMRPDPQAWLEWAISQATGETKMLVTEKSYRPGQLIDSRITTFIKLRPELLHYELMQEKRGNAEEARILPTPRAWGFVNRILQDPHAPDNIKRIAISGLVGSQVATTFFSLLDELQTYVTPEELLQLAKCSVKEALAHLPKTMAGLWHVGFGLLNVCSKLDDYKAASRLIEAIGQMKSELPVAEVVAAVREKLIAKIHADKKLTLREQMEAYAASVEQVEKQGLGRVLSDLT